ncbi:MULTISPECIES: RDD family protein [unclassified Streptomyces]|uniref:RDD family protein n=1 Tax=unclassified Streptomyces TaxID=2593676 RepID=UPI003D70DE9E
MSAPTPAPGDDRPRAGYYPDPSIPGYVRYWNGASWVPGTSRPAPGDGEPLAPPPGAFPVPAVEETGPHFFDEDPQPTGPSAPADGPGPSGDRAEPASAWAADRSRQAGFGGDHDRRVSWGADPRTPAPSAAPPENQSERATPAAGSGGDPGGAAPDPSGTFVFRRPTVGPAGRAADPAPGGSAAGDADPGTMTFRAPQPRSADHDGARDARPAAPDPVPTGGAVFADPAAGPSAAGSGAGAGPGRAPSAHAPSAHASSGQAPSGHVPPGQASSGHAPSGPAFGAPPAPLPGTPAGPTPPASGVPAPAGTAPAAPAAGPAVPAPAKPGFAAGKAAAERASADRAAVRAASPAVPGPSAPAPSGPQSPDAAASHTPSAPAFPGTTPAPDASAAAAQASPAAPVTSGPGGGQPSWAQQVHQLAGGAGGGEQPVAPWKPPVEDVFQAAARRQAAARPAPLGKRLAARLVDTVVLGAVTTAAAVPLGTRALDHVNEKIDAAKLSGRTVTVWILDGTTAAYLGVVLAVLLLFGALYEALPTARWGRTLGKKLFGLEVRDIEGHEPPTFGAALRRWLVYSVPGLLAVGVVGVLWGLIDKPWRQCWHDKAAHTFVAG